MTRVFSDSATSGALKDRHGLDELKQAATQKELEAVIVDDLSRLGRNQLLIFQLKVFFATKQITLHSVNEGISTADSSSDLMVSILSMINEHKLTETRNQTLRGQRDKA